jgi:RHS repeat-associated protein
MKSIKSLFPLAIFLFSLPVYSQITGGFKNSSSTPQEVSSLNPEAYSGEVNKFTGSYNQTQNLGTVSTPNGISFTLTLNYNSSFATGSNVPFMEGIPYGEGWSLNVPFVSVNTASLRKFNETYYNNYFNMTDPGSPDDPYNNPNCNNNAYDFEHEGEVHWFNPFINIPGVISERFVFKKVDWNYDNSESPVPPLVFVAHEFETYIEARFNGIGWSVILPDGTKYAFGEMVSSIINPSNQRMSKKNGSEEEIVDDPNNVYNLTEPKKVVNKWFITSISNPSLNTHYKIKFDYEKHGGFNYHKVNRFAKRYDRTVTFRCVKYKYDDDLASLDPNWGVVYTDIFLKRVYAEYESKTLASLVPEDALYKPDYETGPLASLSDKTKVRRIVTDLIELTYGEDQTLRETHMLHDGKLSTTSNPTNVTPFDNLYNKEVVFSNGNPNTGSDRSLTQFTDWKRYKNQKQFDIEDTDNSSTSTTTILNTNPYAKLESSNYYLDRKVENDANSLAFSHSFLESDLIEPFGGNSTGGSGNNYMPGGDVYEIRTKIASGTNRPFCNFDINIVGTKNSYETSTSPEGAGIRDGYTKVPLTAFSNNRSNAYFSTFQNAEKWNAHIPNSGYMETNNFFALPPTSTTSPMLAGFYIQIGPGNSDHDFSLSADYIASQNTLTLNRNKSAYFNHPAFIGSPSDRYVKKTALPAPQNFGGGFPWYMSSYALDDLYTDPVDGMMNSMEEMYNTWWDSDNTGSQWNPGSPQDHINASTMSNDYNLAKVELFRYSKKPYVLKEVKHYVMNTTVDATSKKQSGTTLNLTQNFKFTYEVLESNVYPSVLTSDQTTTLQAAYERYVILLKEVINMTDPNATSAVQPKTKYDYTEIEVAFDRLQFTVPSGTRGWYHINGGDGFLLTKVTDNLGGETSIEYYEDKDEILSKSLTDNKLDFNEAWATGSSVDLLGPTQAYSFSFVVKETETKISNSEFLITTYNFDFNSISQKALYSVPTEKSPDLPQGCTLSIGDKEKFRYETHGKSMDFAKGFKYLDVIVTGPTSSSSDVHKTSYEFYTTFNSHDHFFGKLKSQKSYVNSTLLSEVNYDYEYLKAYENGFKRWDRFKGKTVSSPTLTSMGSNVSFEYDYSDYYDGALVSPVVDVSDYKTLSTSPSHKLHEDFFINSTTGLQGRWETPINEMLNYQFKFKNRLGLHLNIQQTYEDKTSDFGSDYHSSFFIKKVKTTSKDYDKGLGSGVTKTSTSVTEYSYYDADYEGITTCQGFDYILDDYTSSFFQLLYEPSWMLYTTKTYSLDNPERFSKKEFFYYYDLIQAYNITKTDFHAVASYPGLPFISNRNLGSNYVSNTYQPGLDNYLHNGLEALFSAHFFGKRSILMEERVTNNYECDPSESGCESDHFQSTYYLYKHIDPIGDNHEYDLNMEFYKVTHKVEAGTSGITNTGGPGVKNSLQSNYGFLPRVDKPNNFIFDDEIQSDWKFDVARNPIIHGKDDIIPDDEKSVFMVQRALYELDENPTLSAGAFIRNSLNTLESYFEDQFVTLNNPTYTGDTFRVNNDEDLFNEFYYLPKISLSQIAIDSFNQDNIYHRVLSDFIFATIHSLLFKVTIDSTIDTDSLKNMSDFDLAILSYKYVTDKNYEEINEEISEEEDSRPNIGMEPPYWRMQPEDYVSWAFIGLDKVIIQTNPGIDQEFITELPALCSTMSYLALFKPHKAKRPILHFKSVEGQYPKNGTTLEPYNESVMPVFPYDHYTITQVNHYDRLGNVKESENAVGLKTINKGYEHGIMLEHAGCSTCVVSKVHLDIRHVGLPVRVETTDNTTTYKVDYEYTNLNQPKKVTTDDQAYKEFEYDGFGRMKLEKLQGNLVKEYAYSTWNHQNSDANFEYDFANPSASYRAKLNYVESTSYTNSNEGVVSRTYIHPIGRTYQVVTQGLTNKTNSTYSQDIQYSAYAIYDQWSRPIKVYKPFSQTITTTNKTLDISWAGVDPSVDLYQLTEYEDNTKSRVLKTWDFKNSSTTGYYSTFEYRYLTGSELMTDLSLTANTADDSKIELLMDHPNNSPTYSAYLFSRIKSTDPDGNVSVAYSINAGPQSASVSKLTASDLITYSGVVNAGLTSKVINPNDQVVTTKNNWMGWPIESTSVDEGMNRFMYNKMGNVVLTQNANGRNGLNQAGTFYTGYTYDKFGRVLNQYNVEQNILGQSDINQAYTLGMPLATLKKFLPLTFQDISQTTGSGSNTVSISFTNESYQHLNTYDWKWKHSFSIGGIEKVVSNYLLILGTKNYDKEFYYDQVPTAYTNLIHSEHSFTPTALKNRLAMELSYDYGLNTQITGSVNVPVQLKYFSYNNDGTMQWSIEQFRDAGINYTVKGLCSKIDYLDYNYTGTNATKNVYLQSSINTGTLTLKKQYFTVFDEMGRTSETYLNGSDVKASGNKLSKNEYNKAFGYLDKLSYFDKDAGCSNVLVDEIEYIRNVNKDNRLTRIQSLSGLFHKDIFYNADAPSTNNYGNITMPNVNSYNNGQINATATTYSNACFTDQYTVYGYTYDNAGRLTLADASLDPNNLNKGDAEYTYDAVGNLTQMIRNDGTAAATYNYSYQTGTNLLSGLSDQNSTPIKSYTYDNQGNTTRKTANGIFVGDMIYGRANQIFGITNNYNNGYLYNAADIRIFKKDNNSINQYYLYDASGAMITILDLNTPQVIEWQAGVAKEDNNGIRTFYLTDHLGNTKVTYTTTITCSTTVAYNVVNAIDYFPYSKILRSYTTSGIERFLITGHERDAETAIAGNEGFDYKIARYYDSDIGRFLTPDPMADHPIQIGLSSYSAFWNNPIYWTDPTGLCPTCPDNANEGDMHIWAGTTFTFLGGQWGMTFSKVTVTPSGTTTSPWDGFNFNDIDQYVNNISYVQSQNNVDFEDIGLALLGVGTEVGNKFFYDAKGGTWAGKNFRTYSTDWGGNGPTGGKNKFARPTSMSLRIAGYGLGIYNFDQINKKHSRGEISDFQMFADQGSNLYSTFGGIHGAAWGLGWEAGRLITEIPGYNENFRLPVQRYFGLIQSPPKCLVCPIVGKQ